MGETIAGALEAGAVGCNLEDGTGDAEAPLRAAAEHAERVAAAREAGERAGVPLVINARTDVLPRAGRRAEERLAAAVERGRAYREAGADCIFVPGLADAATIERLLAELDAPVSLLAAPDEPAAARARAPRRRTGQPRAGLAGHRDGRAARRRARRCSPSATFPRELAFRPG